MVAFEKLVFAYKTEIRDLLNEGKKGNKRKPLKKRCLACCLPI